MNLAGSNITYILLDAECMEDTIQKARELNSNHQSLYRTRDGADEVSPDEALYLFTWPHSEEFCNLLLQQGWGKSWGILIKSSADFKTLYQHLRRFLTVQLEGGAQVRFRFYDPGVFRIFIPTCDRNQLIEFFGPVDQFICEDEDADYAIVYSLQINNLKTDRIAKKEVFGLRVWETVH